MKTQLGKPKWLRIRESLQSLSHDNRRSLQEYKKVNCVTDAWKCEVKLIF